MRTSPISAARSQPGTERSAASAPSQPRRRDEGDELALVRDVHRVDSQDLGRAGHRRVAPVLRASLTSIATCEERASSLSTEATPPRVASRMQRSVWAGLLEQRVHDRPQRARVGLDVRVELELAAREHDRRAVLADRAGQQDAVAGADRVGREPGARVALADAGGADVHAVGRAALHDLGVAAHDLHLGRLRGRRDRLHLGLQVVGGEALLEDQRERERARARARHGEVVHGAVHGEVADRAAREAERLDHERVGR